jgi:hypothetical protein
MCHFQMMFAMLLSFAPYHITLVENIQQCYDEINEDLERIYDWSIQNGLKLNPKKAKS